MAGPLMAQQGKFILFLASDPVHFRDILGGYTHVIAYELTEESALHEPVDDLLTGTQTVTFASTIEVIGSTGHTLDTDGGTDIDLFLTRSPVTTVLLPALMMHIAGVL